MIKAYLPSLGTLLTKLGKINIFVWMLFAMLLSAHLYKKCVVRHTTLWLLAFVDFVNYVVIVLHHVHLMLLLWDHVVYLLGHDHIVLRYHLRNIELLVHGIH